MILAQRTGPEVPLFESLIKAVVCNCEMMPKITVTVDDELYKRASMAAAERDTSIPALVKVYLEQLAAQQTDTERLKRKEREIRNRITAFTASHRLSRDDVHERSHQ